MNSLKVGEAIVGLLFSQPFGFYFVISITILNDAEMNDYNDKITYNVTLSSSLTKIC
jgi:hypothetical protein